MAIADTAQLLVRIGLDDKISGGLGRISGQLKGLDAAANQVGRGIRQTGQGAMRVLERSAVVAAGALGYAVKSAGDFEASLNTINTIVKLPAAQLKTLGEGIRTTFTQTGVPIDELTSAYYDLLSAGVKVEDAQSVLNTSVRLGIGGLATTKESVDLLTTAMNSYGLNASGAAKASDIFAAAVRDGKVTVAELSGSFADVAPLAAQAGVKLEEIGAAYATLTARGVPAADVGTQVNRALIELLKPGPKLVTVMKTLGLSSFETSIKQKGLVRTLQDVRDAANKAGIPFQDLFGRLEGYKFALATTGENNAAFTRELDAMGKSAGETAAQFSERQQGLNYQLGVLKANAQNAGITIGTALIPKLVPLIEKLNAFIQEHQADIATFGEKLASGLSSFADKLGTIDFSGVIDGLKLLGDVGKKVVDIFLSLPPNIQGALVAGLAINKLSGGLIGSGLANITGGLLKLVFTRGNSPAAPLYTWNVNGGIGGGGGPGGGGLPLALPGVALGFAALAQSNATQQNRAAGVPAGLDLPGDWLFGNPFRNAGKPVPVAIVEDRTPNLPGAGGHHPKGYIPPAEGKSLVQRLTDAARDAIFGKGKLGDAELIARLRLTSEFGAKGIGTKIEHGPLTGTDPFGEQALALFRAAQFPQQGKTLGEIQRHIIAAEEVQKQYLVDGDINSAKRTQAVIDGMHALLGSTDKTPLAISQLQVDQASRAERLQRALDPVSTSLSTLAGKDFSPTVQVNLSTTNQISISNVVRSFNSYTTAYGTGPGGTVSTPY